MTAAPVKNWTNNQIQVLAPPNSTFSKPRITRADGKEVPITPGQLQKLTTPAPPATLTMAETACPAEIRMTGSGFGLLDHIELGPLTFYNPAVNASANVLNAPHGILDLTWTDKRIEIWAPVIGGKTFTYAGAYDNAGFNARLAFSAPLVVAAASVVPWTVSSVRTKLQDYGGGAAHQAIQVFGSNLSQVARVHLMDARDETLGVNRDIPLEFDASFYLNYDYDASGQFRQCLEILFPAGYVSAFEKMYLANADHSVCSLVKPTNGELWWAEEQAIASVSGGLGSYGDSAITVYGRGFGDGDIDPLLEAPWNTYPYTAPGTAKLEVKVGGAWLDATPNDVGEYWQEHYLIGNAPADSLITAVKITTAGGNVLLHPPVGELAIQTYPEPVRCTSVNSPSRGKVEFHGTGFLKAESLLYYYNAPDGDGDYGNSGYEYIPMYFATHPEWYGGVDAANRALKEQFGDDAVISDTLIRISNWRFGGKEVRTLVAYVNNARGYYGYQLRAPVTPVPIARMPNILWQSPFTDLGAPALSGGVYSPKKDTIRLDALRVPLVGVVTQTWSEGGDNASYGIHYNSVQFQQCRKDLSHFRIRWMGYETGVIPFSNPYTAEAEIRRMLDTVLGVGHKAYVSAQFNYGNSPSYGVLQAFISDPTSPWFGQPLPKWELFEQVLVAPTLAATADLSQVTKLRTGDGRDYYKDLTKNPAGSTVTINADKIEITDPSLSSGYISTMWVDGIRYDGSASYPYSTPGNTQISRGGHGEFKTYTSDNDGEFIMEGFTLSDLTQIEARLQEGNEYWPIPNAAVIKTASRVTVKDKYLKGRTLDFIRTYDPIGASQFYAQGYPVPGRDRRLIVGEPVVPFLKSWAGVKGLAGGISTVGQNSGYPGYLDGPGLYLGYGKGPNKVDLVRMRMQDGTVHEQNIKAWRDAHDRRYFYDGGSYLYLSGLPEMAAALDYDSVRGFYPMGFAWLEFEVAGEICQRIPGAYYKELPESGLPAVVNKGTVKLVGLNFNGSVDAPESKVDRGYVGGYLAHLYNADDSRYRLGLEPTAPYYGNYYTSATFFRNGSPNSYPDPGAPRQAVLELPAGAITATEIQIAGLDKLRGGYVYTYGFSDDRGAGYGGYGPDNLMIP